MRAESSASCTEPQPPAAETVAIRAHRRSIKRLGHWTTARRFDVRASRGSVVLDLLLPRIEPGAIELRLDIDHTTVKLLLPEGANIDDGELRRVGRGGVKEWGGTAAPGGRRIVLSGEMRNAEIRVRRGGVAILPLLLSRAHRAEVREAHREGRLGEPEARPQAGGEGGERARDGAAPAA